MPIRVAGTNANLITDTDLERLAKDKLEARFVHDGVSSSLSLLRPFMSTQFGYADFSANDSATIISRTFPIPERLGNIIGAKAHVMNHNLKATVTDITATSITVACGPWIQIADTGTGSSTVVAFSAITSAAVRVWWEVISTPQP